MIESLTAKSVNAEELIKFWRRNPIQAVKDIYNVDLDWYQRIALEQMWFNRNQTNIFGRGCGKTYLCGLCASLEGLLKSSYRIGLVGPSFRQATLMFDVVADLYNKSPIFQQSAPKGPIYATDKRSIRFQAAAGKTPTAIEAIPMGTDGSKIRGLRYFTTYIDEAAQAAIEILNIVVKGFGVTHANPMEQVRMLEEQNRLLDEGLITADEMQKTTDSRTIFSTTAFFQYNHAWERVSKLIEYLQQARRKAQDKSKFVFKGKSLNDNQIPHRVMTDGQQGLCVFTCLDPSPGFIDMHVITDARREMSDYLWKMEYGCLFPPDSDGFFQRSTLDKARNHVEFGPILEPRAGCFYALGVDPARDGDNFSIAVFEVEPSSGSIRLVRVFAWNKKTFPEAHQHVRRLIRHYRVTYFQMDAGGGGTTIRDLLASRESCPIGDKLILERDFDEHRALTGERILGPLVQFSNYNWVHDANHNLLSGLQHGRLRIAAKPPIPGVLWVPEMDDADDEMERTLTEMSSIIQTPVGQRTRWETPTKTMRKDRYSAVLIGYDAALKLLDMHSRPKRLCGGFWG